MNQAIVAPTLATLGTGGANIYVPTGVLTGAEYTALTGKTTFDLSNFAPSDLLLRFDLAGDITGSGHITLDDYLAIDEGFAKGLTGYANGDFNHDGSVDAADYALNYLDHGNATLADSMISLHTAEFGTEYTSAFDALAVQQAVPEPASLTVLALGAIGLLRVRRRK
jgi:hypothetical protein